MSEITQRLANLSPAKRKLLELRLQKKKETVEPIAIVGLGARFAGARSLADYWRVIRDGIDATSEVPPSRWSLDEFYDPSGEQDGKMSVKWGGFVEGVDEFDPQFFGIAPREARKMDPQQRLLLEVAWEALEHGGLAPEALVGSNTGVFVGIGGQDYTKCAVGRDDYFQQIDAHSGTGNALSIAANRISYILDLHGPSMAIDTACSSGLLGVHLAVQALRNRECDAALAGGVNCILTPETTIAFSKARMLSSDGHCRPFDSAANGYVRGEGCGILVLKRLKDALQANDRVLAVIRGSATNQDGRTSGITAPNGTLQQAVIRAALAQAGLTPERVSYIEAHGTGTPLGDPIEVQALANVFKQKSPADPPLFVTSVKSNVGHTETVSGVAGLIKTVLLLQAGRIFPQLHLKSLNPNIRLDGSRIRIPDSAVDWRGAGGSRIAGVSSFGFGGANVHVVVEEAEAAIADLAAEPTTDASSHLAPRDEPSASDVPALGLISPSEMATERPLHVLALSAKTPTAIAAVAGRYHDHLTQNPDDAFTDVLFSANTGRTHFNTRTTILAGSREQLLDRLAAVRDGKSVPGVKSGQVKIATRPKIAFLFTGQGSQYVGMGRQLYENHPVFRRTLDQCDEILHDLRDESLLRVLYPEPGRESPLDETAYTQPALFALEYSLASLWRSWGLEPGVMLGHSVGEYVAACVAGVFTLEEGLRLISDRSRLMQQLPQDGLMAVLFTGPERVAEVIAPFAEHVSIAAANGPENTVLSGRADVVRRLVDDFKSQGISSQMLTVSHAFHSPLMEPMLDEFEQLAGEVDYQRPRIPIAANVTGQLADDTTFNARYWRDHIRGTVRFADGMRRLAELAPHAIIEVGPSASLTGMGRRCEPKLQTQWVPSLRKGQEDVPTILGGLADLYVLGLKINWSGFDAPWPRKRLALPTYPFERQHHWWDEGLDTKRRSSAAARGPSLHPLLGCSVPTALTSRVFEVPLSSRSPHYLVDHQVQGSPVVPAAAYVEQGLAAAQQVFGPGRHTLENVSIQAAMFLPEDTRRTVQVTASSDLGGECTFETYSTTDDAGSKARWTMHATGRLRHADKSAAAAAPRAAIDLDEVRRRVVATTDRETFYAQIATRGLAYGPAFQVLADLRRTPADALAEIQLPDVVRRELAQYTVHPALGDALLQSMAGAVPLEQDGSYSPYTYLPVAVRRVVVHGDLPTDPAAKMFTYARRTSDDDRPSPEVVEGDVLLLDESGRVLVEFGGCRVQRIGRPARTDGSTDVRDWLYRVAWQPEPLAADSANPAAKAGAWLVFEDSAGLGAGLATQLRAAGHRVVTVRPSSANLARLGDDAFSVDPLDGAAIQRLFDDAFGATPVCHGVVHAWSLDIPALDADSTALDTARRLGTGSALQLIQQLVRARFKKPPQLWLVTRGAQATGSTDVAPEQSSLWGLGRVAAMEHADLRCRLVDLDPARPAVEQAATLVRELAADANEDQIAYRGDTRLVARLAKADDLLAEKSDADGAVPAEGPFRLRLREAGSFDSLKFEPCSRLTPGQGQVEIEVRAAGLNFSDVLKAMGLYPGITDAIVPLGIECSGVVTAVGEGVTRFAVGDEVFGVAPYSFSSHAITADYAIAKKPSHIDHEEAATIPITFLTAYYGLVRLAHVQPGERVLIHAGAGGVGLAAIQICRDIGCEIFCTAGSDSKREYLRSLGVQHVYSSRTLDFADEILRDTNHEGVDVVLNSLPGDFIPKSLAILRAYGRFLEIGKTDIYSNRMIGLLPFQDNLSYSAIDLDRMLRQRPEYIRGLYDEVLPYFARRTYEPLALTRFAIDDTVGAFRYMAQRKNIGKVVVSLERPEAGSGKREEDSSLPPPVTIRPAASYLITGGLGALGLQVSEWLLSQGARHLALLGRRAPSGDAAAAIARWEAAGARVAVLRGDAADRASLEAALQSLPADFPPLRGVMHAAGVLDDGVLYDMSLARLDKAMEPKVAGGWNLHAATLGRSRSHLAPRDVPRQSTPAEQAHLAERDGHIDQPLDFFVLFSSVACVLGSPGQGNYAAGNSFLDGLAAYRRRRGLPALSINWGPWAGSGMAATGDVSEQIKQKGMGFIPPKDGLELLGKFLRTDAAQVAVMDVRWNDMIRLTSKRQPPLLRPFAAQHAGATPAESSQVDTAFRAELFAVGPDERKEKLRGYFTNELARIMGLDPAQLDVTQPLNTIGLDSLMAMELKNNLEAKLAFSLPMQKFLEGPSVTSLADTAAELLAEQAEESPAADAPSASASANGKNGNGKNGKHEWSPIVRLSNGHTEPTAVPLFCVHPVGGDVRCFLDLARRMPERPIYALRARGIEPDQLPHDSVAQLATDYLAAIRRVQPEGPLHLAGWSTGGIFAYEMARQLLAQGEPVGGLWLFDTPTPSILSVTDLEDDARFLYDLVNFSNYFAGTSMKVNYEELRALPPEARLELAMAQAKEQKVVSPDASTDHIRRVIDTCKAHLRALMAYEPSALDTPVLLFRPEDTSILAEAAHGQALAADLGWGKILGRQLTIRPTSGDHFTMMTGDHMQRLVAELKGSRG